jgi:hypothetical protein
MPPSYEWLLLMNDLRILGGSLVAFLFLNPRGKIEARIGQ